MTIAPERTYAPTTSTPNTIVADLWREGWFIKTSKAIVRTTPTLDARDVASEAVFTAMTAASTWDESAGYPLDKWVKFRTRGAMIHEYRKHMKYINGLSVTPADQPVCEGTDVMLADLVSTADSAEEDAFKRVWADARTMIEQAISELTPRQQIIARSRMHTGKQRESGRVSARGNWPGAKYQLRMRLWSLKWMVRG